MAEPLLVQRLLAGTASAWVFVAGGLLISAFSLWLGALLAWRQKPLSLR